METKKVKVRVRSAVLKTFWYSKFIGKVFEVNRSTQLLKTFWYSKFIGKVFEVNRSTQFKDRYELVLDERKW